jgi:hypothetical protein
VIVHLEVRNNLLQEYGKTARNPFRWMNLCGQLQ